VTLLLTEKMTDSYCVLPILQIYNESILTKGPEGCPKLFTKKVVESILTSCSSPVFNVPSFNFRTRNEVYKVYQAFVLHRSLLLLQLSDPQVFIHAVLNAIENEKDPRNLVIGYDLIIFIIQEYGGK
jgi:DNA repair/transcription protein MET18/MMS19